MAVSIPRRQQQWRQVQCQERRQAWVQPPPGPGTAPVSHGPGTLALARGRTSLWSPATIHTHTQLIVMSQWDQLSIWHCRYLWCVSILSANIDLPVEQPGQLISVDHCQMLRLWTPFSLTQTGVAPDNHLYTQQHTVSSSCIHSTYNST